MARARPRSCRDEERRRDVMRRVYPGVPIEATGGEARRSRLWWKRPLDLVLGTLALALGSLPILALALAVMIDSRGRPFFAQERVGRGGRSFRMWKLRTMHERCDQSPHERAAADWFAGRTNGSGYKTLTDPRITRIGRAMRHQHWLISGLALVGAGLALIAAFLRPATYEGSALLSIDQTQEAGQGFDVAMQTDQFLTQRFISMAGSQVVLNQVCSEEGPGCSTAALARQVRATTPRATGQVQVLADSSEPITAARLANEVADAVLARHQAH